MFPLTSSSSVPVFQSRPFWFRSPLSLLERLRRLQVHLHTHIRIYTWRGMPKTDVIYLCFNLLSVPTLENSRYSVLLFNVMPPSSQFQLSHCWSNITPRFDSSLLNLNSSLEFETVGLLVSLHSLYCMIVMSLIYFCFFQSCVSGLISILERSPDTSL